MEAVVIDFTPSLKHVFAGLAKPCLQLPSGYRQPAGQKMRIDYIIG
jgi:hypothetical protein